MSCEPTYTKPFVLSAGDETTQSPASYCHSIEPFDVCSAYKLPSSEPTYTTPAASSIAGDERTCMPVLNCHSIVPVVLFTAYTELSLEPTYTVPFASIAGVDTIEPAAENDHTRAPVV